MAKNTKTIGDQIADMEKENEELRKFQKKILRYLKKGADFLEQESDENVSQEPSDFEKKICEFYELKNDDEKQEYLSIMLNDKSKDYWTRTRQKPADTEETP